MDQAVALHPHALRWLNESELGCFSTQYLHYLAERRYTPGTAHAYLCCVAHFARWLTRSRLSLDRIDDRSVRRFLDEHLPRCACPPPVHRQRHELRAALKHLLRVLAMHGAHVPREELTPVEEELRRFDEHMRGIRGLASNTRKQRVRIVRGFLTDLFADRPLLIPGIKPDAVHHFVMQRLQRWSVASCHVLAGALRGYLRYRGSCGDQVRMLLGAIPSAAHWRLAPLPEVLTESQLEHLLDSFTPGMPSARRAYAMVRCVVDLGLRASEVVRLRLDDIDWHAGIVKLARSKSRRTDVLPLPAATGHAIAQYLQFERPATTNRALFVRHVAPRDVPIGAGVLRRAVQDAFRRCGMPQTRVHVLRHTLASRLLERGSPLKEIADVLRHRALDTSLIYTKLDMKRLAAVALPWPGSAS